jgi:hypothetical protein
MIPRFFHHFQQNANSRRFAVPPAGGLFNPKSEFEKTGDIAETTDYAD